MQPLDKRLRNQLENIVVEARELAERAARAALEELGVEEASPFPDQSAVQRELRRRLRLHGRQLGDPLNGGKAQGIDRLVEEVAYEHWHRMLFARFLAENALLMYPDPDGPVPVTLQDCEDLAVDEGAANGWELAARYAAQMLPQIFRVDSPAFELKLPTNFQRPLERLLADLPTEVFTASDALGWVYQFWQTNNKERINKSEVKIGARELPAVTQLFTEPYMVSFLLDNALGAWWAARRLSDEDLRTAPDEETLRRKAAIPGVPLEYLRFVEETDAQGATRWCTAAGSFSGWTEDLGALKTLDPCCGSGHFLVSLLLMLVPMRMEMEGLDARQAVDAVLRDNLHGLEIDQRCVELAAFALALTAWRYPGAGGYRKLPEIQVACSGLSVSVAKEEWKQLGLGRKNLSIALDWMHDVFCDAPVLGSLLNPAKTDAAKVVQWDELSTVLDEALQQESTDEQREVAVVAHGLAKAATLLAGQYHWVVTNVPYLKRGKQSQRLRDFCEKHYPAAKADLAIVFLDRCLELCTEGGSSSIVLPQNWLFLASYKRFREKLLKADQWNLVARMGEHGFDSPQAAGAFTTMITLTRGEANRAHGALFDTDADTYRLRGLDVSEPKTVADKAAALLSSEVKSLKQTELLGNPDARITFEVEEAATLLSEYAEGLVGLQTSDDSMFLVYFWELPEMHHRVWEYMQGTPSELIDFAGMSYLVRWEQGEGLLLNIPSAYPTKGLKAVGKSGVAIHRMRVLAPYRFARERFHQNVALILPENDQLIPAIWCFCSSPEYNEAVRDIDQSLKVTNATLVKVPFDLEHWKKVAAERYPNGLPQPYTNDPTQWIFHGHLCGSVIWDEESKWTAQDTLRTDETVLQVAVARLLGYRWPAELDPEMELATEQRDWVERSEALLPHVDDDGIVCIPPVRGEAAAADRLLSALAAAYGEQWSNEVLAKLLRRSGHAGKTLESWLRDKFFAQHCKLFQNRPFIWQIWDGLRDGFSALLNYHRLDYKNLETVVYTYLGDWIKRQKQYISSGVDGAQEKLDAAEVLKERLLLILEGEKPYDIFVRWKPLAEQPIGWNPDLNDGVRLNIRPFMTVPDIKKSGAGVLRDKPNIHWKKDRGKDVESAPWFHTFGGERINDHHLGLVEKLEARGDGG
ncbi:restriction endonuclease subunit M [Spiribacter sp. SSL99]|uniref:Eco57I restriction-modification methylase domain-containing protein n=1 Tax=Spiribacter sp. SSL99 TaxID=1866884 RepID=UPI00133011B2|nr:restriction endonuclease subunit M [Spiribacter sp. SSL99]